MKDEPRSLLERRVEDLEDEYARVLEIGGLVQEIERKVNELRAVMMPDALGNGGIISRVKRLERKDEQQERSLEVRLKFWGPIVIACITSGALVFKEWPDIVARWNHNMQEYAAAREPAKKTHHKKKPPKAEEETQEESE